MARVIFAAAVSLVAAMVVQAAVSEVTHGTHTLGKKTTTQLEKLLHTKDFGAMALELEEVFRSGETPAFDLIAMIKSTIQNAIMPNLQTTRNTAAQDTKDRLDAVELCNNQSKTKELDIEGSTQVLVNNARMVHAACRDVEKALYDHNLTHTESYCVRLGEFLHGATHLKFLSGYDREDSVSYVKYASGTNMCSASKVTELADNCTAKEEELENKTVDCSNKQEAFEDTFCTWKTELEMNRKTLDTCHSTALTAYINHVIKTTLLVEKWNVEEKALEKILCYCNVWLTENDERDNRSQHNATHYDVCKNQTYMPAPTVYGTPAEKVSCLLTSVANYPGTSGFITQEYSSFAGFYAPVSPCGQATTAAPTTQATTSPTTTPTTTDPWTPDLSCSEFTCPFLWKKVTLPDSFLCAHYPTGCTKELCCVEVTTTPSYLTTVPPTTTTEAPTTQAPTTEAPTTEAPTTEAPTTEAPTTEAPTTEAPTTKALTTMAATAEASYVQSALGGSTCPPGSSLITDPVECQSASEILGLDEWSAISIAALPPHCIYNQGRQAAFNSDHSSPGSMEGIGFVCKS